MSACAPLPSITPCTMSSTGGELSESVEWRKGGSRGALLQTATAVMSVLSIPPGRRRTHSPFLEGSYILSSVASTATALPLQTGTWKLPENFGSEERGRLRSPLLRESRW